MKRNIFIAVMVVVCFVLQSTLFRSLSFGGIAPNLLIILTAAFGFMCGKTCGLLVGFSAGLLYDIFFGDVLCFHALIYMYIGYINGNFKQIFYKDDIKLPIVLIMASDFVLGFTYYVLLFLLRGRFHFMHYLTSIMIPEVVYTIVVTLVLYPFIRFVTGKLEQGEKRSEDSFA
ncbi:MAG: rod shape-determining protein MreD [Lachnospiraceae bacterium]|nr:rod shape-determining protein MreD [Lachnospiraceae bacterium]